MVPDSGDSEITDYEVHTSEDGEFWSLQWYYYDTDDTGFTHDYLGRGNDGPLPGTCAQPEWRGSMVVCQEWYDHSRSAVRTQKFYSLALK